MYVGSKYCLGSSQLLPTFKHCNINNLAKIPFHSDSISSCIRTEIALVTNLVVLLMLEVILLKYLLHNTLCNV